MKRRWTVVSAALVLVVTALIIAVTPIDFVLRSPGPLVTLVGPDTDPPVIQVSGYPVERPQGTVWATTIDQSAPGDRVTLLQAVFHYLRPAQDVLPRDVVYTAGQTSADAGQAADQALAAGVRQAGLSVTEQAMVQSVREGGPASGLLLVGDLIIRMDNTDMGTAEQVRAYIRERQIGDTVVVVVKRRDIELTIPIENLVASVTNATIPTMGDTLTTGYTYSFDIKLSDSGQAVAGADHGLALALATYDLLTPGDDTAGWSVAAVGQVTSSGQVSGVTGINEHVASASQAQADLVLIPAQNCGDLEDPNPAVTVVPVATLSQAVEALRNRGSQNLPHC